MLAPGDLVMRNVFINYVYRWCDCDMSEGVEQTAYTSPLLSEPFPGMTVDRAWPEGTIAIVVYVSTDADAASCLVCVPHTGLAWVPVHRIERICTSCEEDFC